MLAARNLHVWTTFSGTDPETNTFAGYALQEGFVTNPSLPPARYVIVRLTLGM